MRALSRFLERATVSQSSVTSPRAAQQHRQLIPTEAGTLRAAVMGMIKTAMDETDIPPALHGTIQRLVMQRSDDELRAMATQLVEAARVLAPFVTENPAPSPSTDTE